MPTDPRLRVLFVAAVAGGAFLLKDPRYLLLLCVANAALALGVGIPLRRLLRQAFKLWGFALLVLVSFVFFGEDSGSDRFRTFEVLGHSFALNVGGLWVGSAMVLRVVAIVFASHVARAGDERAIAHGLAKLGAPPILSLSIDATLALLGGRGGGGGGGGRRSQDGAPREGFWKSVKRMAAGDVGPLAERARRQMERAERHATEVGGHSAALARDVGVIAGMSLTMLGIKAVKILPSLPFAPGHKLVLLTPLYVLASLLTKSRFGATWTGLAMGTVAFLMGDGKYGVFEILKHVIPGLLCDLCVPLLAEGGRRPGKIVWAVVSGVIAAARFAGIFVMTLLAQPPSVAFAFLLPGLSVHVLFGVLAGLIIPAVIRAFDPMLLKGPQASSLEERKETP